MKSSSLAPTIAPPTGQGDARLRLAVVLASPAPTGAIVHVQIQGGTEVFHLPYPGGYVPQPGDLVQVLSIGSGSTETATVLHPVAGHSGNRVLNGQMAVGDADFGVAPLHWTHYRASGPVDIVVTGGLWIGDRLPVMVFGGNTALASDNYAVSAPFPVKPGEQYELSSVGYVEASDPSLTASIVATWFNSAEGVYPDDTVSGDITAQSAVVDESLSPQFSLQGTVTVPANTVFMRVAVRIQQAAGAGAGYVMYWRSVYAYKA